jgi:hypothetical protein
MVQAVQGRVRICARRPKKWAAKNAKDRWKCGQSTNVGALKSKIMCESNRRRETVQQIVKEDLGMRKISAKMVPRILAHDQKNVGFTFHLIFYSMKRCLIGSLSVMKRGVLNTIRKQNDRPCS